MKTNNRFTGEVALKPGSTTEHYQVGKLRDVVVQRRAAVAQQAAQAPRDADGFIPVDARGRFGEGIEL